jgi:hypothetical protein
VDLDQRLLPLLGEPPIHPDRVLNALRGTFDGVAEYTPRSIWLRYGFETLAMVASCLTESDMNSRCVRMNSPSDVMGGGFADMLPCYRLDGQAHGGLTQLAYAW